MSPFMLNAVRWLDEGRNGLVGVVPQLGSAHTLLSKSGLPCEKSGFRKELSVYVCTSYSDAQADEIQDFVAEGGGLLIGGVAQHWSVPLPWDEDVHGHATTNRQPGLEGIHYCFLLCLIILKSNESNNVLFVLRSSPLDVDAKAFCGLID
uniref:Uncharacterized protein n=1 Tax=Salmo trutta TaxID=8032 RepID=A0A674CIK1_SALTR